MNTKPLKTPILLMIFNRPETSDVTFELIRKMRPEKLFICADGPRADRPADIERCAKAREIVNKVDWPCELKTLFQEKNLGCGIGSVTGIDWMFTQVEDGIIMDDDCLPDPSFFYYCQELLEYYRDNPKVMHISGNNFQDGKKRGNASYYFSHYTHNWGWATWRRAWKYNDVNIVPPDVRRHIWDKQWLLAVKKQNGLAILPNENLVSNIGFGGEATHTSSEDSEFFNMRAHQMKFPLVHPKKITRNKLADLYTYRHLFEGTLKSLIFKKIVENSPKAIGSKLTSWRNVTRNK
jgi:hypothetical protein